MAEKRKVFNANKYTSHRRRQLKEEMRLVLQRDKITKQIREVRTQMNAWDRHLIMEGEK